MISGHLSRSCHAPSIMRAVIAIMVVTLSACSPSMSPEQMASLERSEKLLEGLGQSDEPDTVLLAARAHLHLATVAPRHADRARGVLARLADMTALPDVTGWGLSFAWDAFQDGTVNPSSTIYAYTTAAAALAYLDAYEILGDREYLHVAERAEQVLVKELCCWDNGTHASVWYSDQEADQRDGMQVHNVSALSLAVFERLDLYGISIDRGLTDRLARHLMDVQGTGFDKPDQASPANWAYAVNRSTANDLLHETFIVEGLLWHRDGQTHAARSLSGIVESHFVEGRPRETHHTQGSRGWGPPAALYILIGQPGFEQHVESIAAVFRGNDLTAEHERARGWYALALARHAAGAAAYDLIPRLNPH